MNQRLKQMEDDIITARGTITANLWVLEEFEFHIPPENRSKFKTAIRSSRIELLRLNNVLKSIGKLKGKSDAEIAKDKLDEQFEFAEKHTE